MPCHPIYDFVLSITTSNVVWWNKNVKTTFQEGRVEKGGRITQVMAEGDIQEMGITIPNRPEQIVNHLL